MKKSKNKIYWVLEDFNFIGNHYPGKDQTVHSVSIVENELIDERMVKFDVDFIDSKSDRIEYSVNLLADSHGTGYSGYYIKDGDKHSRGEITCQLYKNSLAYLLMGTWIEDGYTYTWWSRIEK